MNQLNLLSKLRSIFENESNIIFAYLFGSMARNRTRFGSDMDIAVYFKTEPSLHEIGRLSLLLEETFNCKVDLVELNKLENHNPVLAFSILSEGMMIISKENNVITRFTKSVLLFYFDFKPTNDLINNYFSYRLSNNQFAVCEKK
ncbi:MAG: nucleotidyltransferase domain-containing protein [Ignavibacteria bacterium]|nr:nucleotidyltransferase domain-containing protein [Ignavibacteria bacterium]